MWTEQLKELAIQLAKTKDLKERLSIILNDTRLSGEQRTALKFAYAAPAGAISTERSSEPYWG